jgi:C-terminal processing protease CtpA/Prc
MAAAIRAKAAKGGYDAVKSDVDLATAVTQDLRAASHEQRTTLEFDGPGGSSPDKSLTLREAKSRTEHGFGVGGRLPGNIERMVIRSFEPVDDTRDAVEDHFAKAADADGLLLDLTECTGGDPATVAYVVSYLVGSGTRIHLVDTTWRNTGTTEATWTEPSPPGRTFVHKPVVVLTSSLTTTACEEMAYDLRALHRATMVGETTAGVADPVALERVAPMFVLRFPVGRLTSAITHKSWEGVGVVPDEQVPPQETMQKGYIRLLRALIASPALPQGTRNGLKMALKAMGGE